MLKNISRKIRQSLMHLRFNPADPALQNGSKIFFVTGRPKSGTTWMARLLNAHPQLFCDLEENYAYNRNWLIEYTDDRGEDNSFFTKRMRSLIKQGLLSNLIANCPKFSAVYLGDKTPNLDLDLIFRDLPQAKVLVMLRDPRDVAVSLAFHCYRQSKRWQGIFSDGNLQSIDSLFLRDRLSRFQQFADEAQYLDFARKQPEQCTIVRYEDLHANGEMMLAGIFQFLKVPASQRLIDNAIAANTFERMSGGRQRGEVDRTAFVRKGIVGDWRNHFSSDNIQLCSELIGASLTRLGYE
ncbi:sulfotransferase [Synechococcus sp. PCC 7336]|uniref:sulfotransferase family protein n=1 Tax=Synechococcus sp. PCC 7336 TaxID=195250 RepID=UPI00034C3F17|nr:sulfotransferase [Synechococcus sp. PCC 7336]